MATKKTTTKSKSAPRRTKQKHYRNLRYTPVSIRLKELDRKIALQPRGQRGDIAPLKSGETSDPDFIANKDILFEVITDEEAKQIVEKQTTNQQAKAVHPALREMRNERGEEYADGALKVEIEEDRSKVVAYTEEVAEGVGNVVVDRGIGIRRAPVPGSVDRPSEPIPDSIGPEEQAEYRLKQTEEEGGE